MFEIGQSSCFEWPSALCWMPTLLGLEGSTSARLLRPPHARHVSWGCNTWAFQQRREQKCSLELCANSTEVSLCRSFHRRFSGRILGKATWYWSAARFFFYRKRNGQTANNADISFRDIRIPENANGTCMQSTDDLKHDDCSISNIFS